MATKAERLEKQKLKLEPRQIGFIHFLMFVTKGDGVRAAEMAGYTGTREQLTKVASRLLKHPGVLAERDRVAALPVPHRPTIANRIEVLEKLTMMLRLDETKYANHRGILGAATLINAMEGYDKNKEAEELYKKNLSVLFTLIRDKVPHEHLASVMNAIAALPAEAVDSIETTAENVAPPAIQAGAPKKEPTDD